eukprot:SAG31_NODE_967_length_10684_cov_58.582239_11_plen_236_part_00
MMTKPAASAVLLALLTLGRARASASTSRSRYALEAFKSDDTDHDDPNNNLPGIGDALWLRYPLVSSLARREEYRRLVGGRAAVVCDGADCDAKDVRSQLRAAAQELRDGLAGLLGQVLLNLVCILLRILYMHILKYAAAASGSGGGQRRRRHACSRRTTSAGGRAWSRGLSHRSRRRSCGRGSDVQLCSTLRNLQAARDDATAQCSAHELHLNPSDGTPRLVPTPMLDNFYFCIH